MTHLAYLICAYSVVWVLICFFLATLILKNRRLKGEMERLENKLEDLEVEIRSHQKVTTT